jgi:hypothetical protein
MENEIIEMNGVSLDNIKNEFKILLTVEEYIDIDIIKIKTKINEKIMKVVVKIILVHFKK